MANDGSEIVITPADIFNSLCVPNAIKDLLKFNGNSRLLLDFLDNVNESLYLNSSTSGTPYRQLLVRAIGNKTVGMGPDQKQL